MSRSLRIGLIGFGGVAQVHLEAYSRCKELSMVAIADTNAERVKVASGLPDINVYESAGDLLQEEALDIACVLTPAASHESVTVQCAEAGVHVLCEKPLSLSASACEHMIDACSANGVQLCYGASYRYLPALRCARQMILSGEIGEVLLLREQAIGGYGPAHRQSLSFAHYPRGGPGGSGMGLVDHGIHLIDVFPWLMNTHTRAAWGRGNISGAPLRPEFACLEYCNGAFGLLSYEEGTFPSDLPQEGIFSWGAGWDIGGRRVTAGGWSAQPNCIHVHGTHGALRIFYYANKLFHRNESSMQQVRVADEPMPANFLTQLMAFADAIRTGASAPVSGEVGLDAVRTLLEIYSRAPSANTFTKTSD